MNTTFREVLQEVLLGLLITKPNVKWIRIRRRCPRMKRVLRRSGFVLGCHVQIMRVRERERERNKQKSTITKSTPKKEKKMYVCMKCAWACYVQRKYIMGSTQSNPNNTQVSTIMHETLWKCKCIAMHEHITSYK